MKHPIRFLILVVTLLALPMLASAGSGNVNFPVPFGPNNTGTDFWVSFPTNWDSPGSYCRLYITSGVATRVIVTVGANNIATETTKPNDIITIDVPLSLAQVVSRTDRDPVPADANYPNRAIHITSDDPIVVYGINRVPFTTDGLLALPVNAIGREYVVASAPDITGNTIQKLPSQYVIVAPYDNTVVSIIQSTDTYGHQLGEAFTVTMNKGDVYSAMSSGPGGDLTGTYISASKPVAVMGGQTCTYLPDARYPACDHLCEELLPVESWGKFYHLVPFANRVKGDLIRIFSGGPDADIFINGSKIATLSRKGGLPGEAWLQLLEPDRRLMEISSNQPIYVAQYNNSQSYDGVATDPFYLTLTPVEQYQTALTFATPSSDYELNFVSIVCDSAAFDSLEIADAGTGDWQLAKSRFPSPAKRFPTLINGVPYVGVVFQIPSGTYQMRGPRPFAGYLYGFSSYDSYGYPLSVAVGNLSKPDTVAPEVTHTQDCDGNVTAQTTDYPNDDAIRTNLAVIRLVASSSFNYEFVDKSNEKFVPNMDRSTQYMLRVVDLSQDARAVVSISDGAGNVTFDTVTYTAFQVRLQPPTTEFGPMNIGAVVSKDLQLVNESDRPVSLEEVFLQLKDQGFEIVAPTGPLTLAPKQQIPVTVKFTATTTGFFRDSVGVRDTCGPRILAEVTATVGQPIIKVSDIDFGAWPVAAGAYTPPRTFEIKNAAADAGVLTVTGVVSGPSNAVFTLPNGLPAFPLMLAPGKTQTVRVDFDPAAVQPYSDAIVFSHNAGDDPQNDSVAVLTGEGIQADLIVTSQDWPRTRVGTQAEMKTITVKNLGNQAISIVGYTTSGDASDFDISGVDIARRSYQPGDTLDLNVRFTPTAIGDRQMQITFETNPEGSSPVVSTLHGIGVEPRLQTVDRDFGSMPVGGTEVELPVRFNLYDPFVDTVTITDFKLAGDPDFRYQLPAGVTLPLKLIPGENESIDVRGFFAAQQAGTRTATLTAVTLDGVDATSNWTGVGTTTQPTITHDYDPPTTCGPTQFDVTIRNSSSSQTLQVTDIQLSGTNPDFSLIGPNPNGSPILISPGGTEKIRIAFDPSTSGVATEQLIITNNSATPQYVIDLQATGNVETKATTTTALTSDKEVGNTTAFGHDVTAHVRIDDDLSGLGVTSYRVTLTYDTTKLRPRTDKIVVGNANPTGATATVNQTLSTPGVLVIDVTLPSELADNGELLSMPFSVTWEQDLMRSVSADVSVPDVGCMTIAPSDASIAVDPICGFSVRLIELTSSKYALDQNRPNPFNPVTTIRYSLGLDGPTKVLLYDASGNLVQTLVDEYQKPGVYEITLDASSLPSGMYYYRIVSGSWSSTRRMMIMQ